MGIQNITVNNQPADGYVGIQNITTNNLPDDGYVGINKIHVNNGPYNKNPNNFANITDNSIQYLNCANSNMNMNLNTNLFNNQVDSMDVFPDYPRPSLGRNDDIIAQFNNFQNNYKS